MIGSFRLYIRQRILELLTASRSPANLHLLQPSGDPRTSVGIPNLHRSTRFVPPHPTCRMTDTFPVAMSESQTVGTDKAAIHKKDLESGSPGVLNDEDGSSLGKGDILSDEHTDPVLSAKMHLINNVFDYLQYRKYIIEKVLLTLPQAIDEIGFTTYQW